MPEYNLNSPEASGDNVVQIRFVGDVQGLQEAARQAQALVQQQRVGIQQTQQELQRGNESLQKTAAETVTILTTTLTTLDRISNVAKSSVEGVGVAFGKIRETLKGFAEDTDVAVRGVDNTVNAVKNLTVVVGEAIIAQRTLSALAGATRAAAGAGTVAGAAASIAGAVFSPVAVGAAVLSAGYQWNQDVRREEAYTAIEKRLGIDTTDYAGAIYGISQRFTQQLYREEEKRAGVGNVVDYLQGLAEVGYRGLARAGATFYEGVAAITPHPEAARQYRDLARIARTQSPGGFFSAPAEGNEYNTQTGADLGTLWNETVDWATRTGVNFLGGGIARLGERLGIRFGRPDYVPTTRERWLPGRNEPLIQQRTPEEMQQYAQGSWLDQLVDAFRAQQREAAEKDTRTLLSHPLYKQYDILAGVQASEENLRKWSGYVAQSQGPISRTSAGEGYSQALDQYRDAQLAALDFSIQQTRAERAQISFTIGQLPRVGKVTDAEKREELNKKYIERDLALRKQEADRERILQSYNIAWLENETAPILEDIRLQDTTRLAGLQVQAIRTPSREAQIGFRAQAELIQAEQPLRLMRAQYEKMLEVYKQEREDIQGVVTGGEQAQPWNIPTTKFLGQDIQQFRDRIRDQEKLTELIRTRITVQEEEEEKQLKKARDQEPINQEIRNLQQRLQVTQVTEEQIRGQYEMTALEAKKSFQSIVDYYRQIMGQSEDVAQKSAKTQIEGITTTARTVMGIRLRNLGRETQMADWSSQIGLLESQAGDLYSAATTPLAREGVIPEVLGLFQQSYGLGTEALDFQLAVALEEAEPGTERYDRLIQINARQKMMRERQYQRMLGQMGGISSELYQDLYNPPMRPQDYYPMISRVSAQIPRLGLPQNIFQAEDLEDQIRNYESAFERGSERPSREQEAIFARLREEIALLRQIAGVGPKERFSSVTRSPAELLGISERTSEYGMFRQLQSYGLENLAPLIPEVTSLQRTSGILGITQQLTQASKDRRRMVLADTASYGVERGMPVGDEMKAGVELGLDNLVKSFGTFGENATRVITSTGNAMAQAFSQSFFDVIVNKAKGLPQIFQQLGANILSSFLSSFANLSLRAIFQSLQGGISGGNFSALPVGAAAVGAGGQVAGGGGGGFGGFLAKLLGMKGGGSPAAVQQVTQGTQGFGNGNWNFSDLPAGPYTPATTMAPSLTDAQISALMEDWAQSYDPSGMSIIGSNGQYVIPSDIFGSPDLYFGTGYYGQGVDLTTGGGYDPFSAVGNLTSGAQGLYSALTAPGSLGAQLAAWWQGPIVGMESGYLNAAEAAASMAQANAAASFPFAGVAGLVTSAAAFGYSSYQALTARTEGQAVLAGSGAIMAGAMLGGMLGSVVPGIGTAIGAAGGALAGFGVMVIGSILAMGRRKSDKIRRQKEWEKVNYEYRGNYLFGVIKYLEADETIALLDYLEGRRATIPADLKNLNNILMFEGRIIDMTPGGIYDNVVGAWSRNNIIRELKLHVETLKSQGRHFGLVYQDIPRGGVTRTTIESVPFIEGEISLRSLANINQRQGIAEVFLSGLDDETAERLLRKLQETAARIDMPIRRIPSYELLNRLA